MSDLPNESEDEMAELFRYAMGSFPSGVTVVSCRKEGMDHAMTASAVSSVSMDPPILLVCVNRSARFWAAINQAEKWAVSILGQQARPHAVWLATPGRPLTGQLDEVPHERTPDGNAVLTQALAQAECRTVSRVVSGDHEVFMGEVEWANRGTGRDPLLYWRSQYRELGELPE